MQAKEVKPRKALNKAFLKVKPSRTEIEKFKVNLIRLLEGTNDTESEEFHKNLISDFLKKTYYDPNHSINTMGRNDLVIHNGSTAKTSVGVILEAKKPTNRAEMLSKDSLNKKAFHELVLYFLRERITNKNLEIRHVVATNVYEWFIFDASVFDRLFAQNKELVKQFVEFEAGRLSETTTEFFYNQIAQPFIDAIETEIEYAYFNLKDYVKPLKNNDKADDVSLIALFKLLSPEHLLKLPFINDSNSLDKRFYTELLHIIGLAEWKEGSKKLIGRSKEGERHTGTILEDAIIQLDSLDRISRFPKPSLYGDTKDERLFNVALELSITWINRILFLKLLEAQLTTYHKGDAQYGFLNIGRIKNYDDLNSLFFQVLARKHDERNDDVKKTFDKIPYLNSSLFEPTDIEQVGLFISNLKDDKLIPVHTQTVLKDAQGKKRTGNLNTLEYLFEFLNAYDFSSEGAEEIQEENKTLINASVLGLIFEKINGYKDGSYFTPGFITMYMCRETIRRAVVQKFNEANSWECADIHELYDKLDTKNRVADNAIVNSIKICDPAVGSGHFLVSALNEIIAVKHELSILLDRNGNRLREYEFDVVNDELIVTDEDGELFEYNHRHKESQRVQEALFHEKQTIIENCLFGVDINVNSVKICRLRLWIELLKHAYYKTPTELETLPNIDINIKCGNSLVSRFAIDADLSQALKKSKWNIDGYRMAVSSYRNAQNKEQKREMETLISAIKSDFRSEISANDPKQKKLSKLSGELFTLTNQGGMFEKTKKEKDDWTKSVDKLTAEIKKLETEIEEIKSNKIFENAFEWRFEFPEVLNDKGDFVGFDSIIANPPYTKVQDLDHKLIDWYKQNKMVAHRRIDVSILFFELCQSLLKKSGLGSYISSNQFLVTEYGRKLRETLLNDFALISMIDYGDLPIFEDALTYVSIFNLSKRQPTDFSYYKIDNIEDAKKLNYGNEIRIDISKLSSANWILATADNKEILQKISKQKALSEIGKCSYGIVSGSDNTFIVNNSLIEKEGLEQKSLLPLIRANNCKRYDYANYDLHIIYPFKYEDGATVLLSELEFKCTYPNTFKYLLSKRKILEERKDSRKTFADSNKWYSLTRYGQLENIKMEKIVCPGEQKKPKFSIDVSHAGYSGARVFGITISEKKIDLKYLLAVLNSKVTAFVIQSTFPVKAGGYFSISSTFIDKLPIVQADANEQRAIIDVVDKILEAKLNRIDVVSLESEIDQMVYKLYDLTEEEIKIVERAST